MSEEHSASCVAGPRRMLFTIGHSTHELGYFVELLKRHGVTIVADVRSQPHSRIDHFCRSALEAELKADEIQYVFLGRELGARRDESQSYVNGQAVYERVAELPAFRAGLNRVQKLAESQIVALLCAEREPLDCHRAVLVARHLVKRGMDVTHILVDGNLENHAETERRMVNIVGVDPLFDAGLSQKELIDRAYTERGREIAYRTTKDEDSLQ